MKHIFATIITITLLQCAAYGAEIAPVLLCNENSGPLLSEIATPTGFVLSPEQAASPILNRITRPVWSIAYLFADSNYYYLVFADTRKGTTVVPDETAIKINGITGEIINPGTNNTEQSVPGYAAQGASSPEP